MARAGRGGEDSRGCARTWNARTLPTLPRVGSRAPGRAGRVPVSRCYNLGGPLPVTSPHPARLFIASSSPKTHVRMFRGHVSLGHQSEVNPSAPTASLKGRWQPSARRGRCGHWQSQGPHAGGPGCPGAGGVHGEGRNPASPQRRCWKRETPEKPGSPPSSSRLRESRRVGTVEKQLYL